MSLKEILQKAVETKTAIGHFNISNWEGIKAIFEVCEETKKPVIIGVSESEAEFFGIENVAVLVKSFRERTGLEIFLNADHFKDLNKVKQAAEADFDSILFDASTPLGISSAQESLEENIKKTKQAVELVKSINFNILVEGELGYIGVGSVVRESVPEGAVIEESRMIKPEEAKKFVDKTGVSLIGPGVGNIHGIVKNYKENISFKRISEIKNATRANLVLHGASGIDDESLKQAIEAGISVVHVNTELRLAWKNSLQKSLADNVDEIAPYKVLKSSVAAIKKVILEKISIFNGK
ncbi:MAG: hypothetical protein A2570_02655 [Candidatus Brennerbacteria bacterium RIFOXYD1_FULL_41_16]|uniref:Tagatose-bisphosphate aldolase n=1 Tax=Candidatus Brennerbacteria bacterium RIFOXYD1_FULL_41_16 TaxID=1797529 RepID=A0A1G1XJA3_9BACT|nr:MAG: hypothetical protein A2570_02655 [Candidatus Brennerbacteria bacterium RIFOXYD1_FULL_41_16]